MDKPEIRIKSSFLLNDRVIPLLTPELEHAGRLAEADKDYIGQKVKEYQEGWSSYEQQIIPAICDILGLRFKQNIIDVYVAPFNNSFSDPMVISTKYSSDRLVDVLTHELIHRLLTDNTKLPQSTGRKLSSHWADLFGNDHSFITLVHIPVHAVLEYIFIDVLNEPERLKRDIEFRATSDDYSQAWDYVRRHGYQTILEQLNDLYKRF